MSATWHKGNAADDGQTTRGWFLGHFINPPNDIRSTGDVEVKWGVHPAGDGRPEWAVDDRRTTLALLVRGYFRIELMSATRNGKVVLVEQAGHLIPQERPAVVRDTILNMIDKRSRP